MQACAGSRDEMSVLTVRVLPNSQPPHKEAFVNMEREVHRLLIFATARAPTPLSAAFVRGAEWAGSEFGDSTRGLQCSSRSPTGTARSTPQPPHSAPQTPDQIGSGDGLYSLFLSTYQKLIIRAAQRSNSIARSLRCRISLRLRPLIRTSRSHVAQVSLKRLLL